MGGMPQGMPSPAQLAQMLGQMSEEERNRFAQMSGIPPQALNQMMQAFQNMSPEQLAQLGAAGGMGGGGAPGGQQPHVIHLTQEEAEAVTRLQELGFSQQEAAEAYLACDRDEAMAANFLFDAGGGGGGFMMPPAPQQQQPPTNTTPATQDSSNTGSTDQGGNSNADSGDSKDEDEDMYS